jgi:hypothetical protein
VTEPAGAPRGAASGSSADRTRLAWRRTALATTAIALLTVRLAVRDGMSAWTGLGIAAAALGWLATVWLAQRRIREMARRLPGHVGRTLPAIALVTVGFAALGIALVAIRGWSVR